MTMTQSPVIESQSGTPANMDTVRQRGSIAGMVMIAGAVTMLVGAAAYGSAGADFWSGIDGGDVPGLLADAAASASTLYLTFSVWLCGALLLGVGGVLAARHGTVASPASEAVFAIGAAVAVVAFVTMASVVRLAAAGGSAEIADAIGFVGIRLDDIATVLLVAFGPVLLTLAGRGDWMPRWLTLWTAVAGVAGFISVVGIFTGGGTTYGIAVVPIGIGWTLAAGIVLVRRGT
ncbi:MAG: hypothetical protein WD734_01645 [Dehalococcoidia bacterium]